MSIATSSPGTCICGVCSVAHGDRLDHREGDRCASLPQAEPEAQAPAAFCSALELEDEPENALRAFMREAFEGAAATLVVLVLLGGLATAFSGCATTSKAYTACAKSCELAKCSRYERRQMCEWTRRLP